MPISDSELHQAEQEALLWQARLSSDLITHNQRAEFQQWLTKSPENRAAWQDVNAFWTGLDSLTPADIGLEPAKPVLPFAKPRRLSVKTGLALAASLLLTLTAVYQQLDFYPADYRSSTGQQSEIALSDGSTLLLNTSSAVSVDFSAQQRLVTLQRGEAFFTVAADAKRPFVVKTGAGEVQALGTAFDVKLRDDGEVDVTVFEHAVKVSSADGQIQARLAAAEHLQFGRYHLSAATPVNLSRAGAWHQQRIVFQDKPLSEVAAELERYRPGKILIVSDGIKNLPITGVFGAADTDLALQALEQSLQIKVRKITDRLVLLSAK
ncbi:FecR family protein [Methylomonas albis]|uniref:FecR family protein n=1 Tax=Methylomonas albis TaxID=1854563 RepID=UPI001CE1759E|nr:FecR family protein [Methylomonas albis]